MTFGLRALGLLILGWAALSVPAYAQSGSYTLHIERFTYPLDDQSRPRSCEGYKAFSAHEANQCVAQRTSGLSGEFGPANPRYHFIKSVSGCEGYEGTMLIKVGSYTSSSRLGQSGNTSEWQLFFNRTFTSRTGATIYSGANCTDPLAGNDMFVQTSITYSATPPDDDQPDDPAKKECALNSEWASWGLPKRATGYVPRKGDKFRIAYRTDIALPAYKTDATPTAPGDLFVVKMSDTKECTMRRETRIHIPSDDPRTLGTMVYTVDYWGEQQGQSVGNGGNGDVVADIVVVAKRKRSRPVVPYGTKFTGGQATSEEIALARALQELFATNACGGNCQTTDGQQVPARVTVKQEDERVPFVHPAPAQLARDNPDCTQKYDPRCAWNPSPTQPATAQTKPEQLVRLSNDGQTIVHNDVKVYADTVYPQVMRDGGTSPNQQTPASPSSPPGDVDNPATGDDDSSGGQMVQACIDAGDCSPTDQKIAGYLSSLGVDTSKDTSPDGVASGIIDKAFADGTCTAVNDGAFCSLAASFASIASRPVPPGDLVISRGAIAMPDGSDKEQTISLKRSVIDFLKLLLAIGTTLNCTFIVLRGRSLGL